MAVLELVELLLLLNIIKMPPNQQQPNQNQGQTYVVQPGDTLNEIASRFGFTNYLEAGITGYRSGNPDLIFPGETLTIGGQRPGGGAPPPPITTSGPVRQEVNRNVDYLNQNLNVLAGIEDQAAKKEAFYDSQLAAFTKQLDDLSARSNAATKNLLRGINADYAQRQLEAADQNDRYQQGLKVLGLQTGTTKFLPFIQQGMLTFAEMEGQKELSRLDGEGKKLLAEAQQAQIDQDFRIVSQKMEAYRENEAMKSRAINDLYDQAQSRQSIQANAMKIGASIAPFLVRELAGLNDMEKQEVLQRIAQEYGVAVNDLLVGLSTYEQERADTERDFAMDERRFGLDERRFGLEQQREARLARGEAREDLIELSADDRRTLLGAGFTAAEISNMESEVRQFGLSKVLEGVTEAAQRSALEKVYGGAGTSKLNRQNISSFFDIPDDEGLSGFWGFFGRGDTNKERLDELMSVIERYQAIGYSDEDIIKLIEEQQD